MAREEVDKAYQWLEKAYEMHDSFLYWANKTPIQDIKLEETESHLTNKITDLHSITSYLNNILKNISQGILFIDLDGTAGYGTSFLEEAFGGLIREDRFSYDVITSTVEYKSDEEEYLIEDTQAYLKEASDEEQ